MGRVERDFLRAVEARRLAEHEAAMAGGLPPETEADLVELPRPKPGRRHIPKALRERALELVRRGSTHQAAAEMVGVHTCTVAAWVKAAGR